MKKEETERPEDEREDMLPEYDFSGKKGVRGEYFQAYRQGHTVQVREDDGTVNIRYFTLEDGAVMLEPDVSEYFPDSEAVIRRCDRSFPWRRQSRRGAKPVASIGFPTETPERERLLTKRTDGPTFCSSMQTCNDPDPCSSRDRLLYSLSSADLLIIYLKT